MRRSVPDIPRRPSTWPAGRAGAGGGGDRQLVHDDGTTNATDAVLALGAECGLPACTIGDLIAWRRLHDRVAEVAGRGCRPGTDGSQLVGYRDLRTGDEHLLLISPRGLGAQDEPPLVRAALGGAVAVTGSVRCAATADNSWTGPWR